MAIAVSSFNTQPPEGGWRPVAEPAIHQAVSTHSRPKAAGLTPSSPDRSMAVSTHSRPKAAGPEHRRLPGVEQSFQHTAARRRLAIPPKSRRKWRCVSTHSRPKAAGAAHGWPTPLTSCFNTQPPEGGWQAGQAPLGPLERFNTQPPEGGWAAYASTCAQNSLFQHTAARRRLGAGLDA